MDKTLIEDAVAAGLLHIPDSCKDKPLEAHTNKTMEKLAKFYELHAARMQKEPVELCRECRGYGSVFTDYKNVDSIPCPSCDGVNRLFCDQTPPTAQAERELALREAQKDIYELLPMTHGGKEIVGGIIDALIDDPSSLRELVSNAVNEGFKFGQTAASVFRTGGSIDLEDSINAITERVMGGIGK